jgi:hypothetical protein
MANKAPATGVRCQWCGGEAVYRTKAPGSLPPGLELCDECISKAPDGWHADRINPIEPVCDFCCQPGPRWTLRVRYPVIHETEMPGRANIVTADNDELGWGACDDCRPFLDARDLGGLVARCVSKHLDGEPEEFVRVATPLLTEHLGGLHEAVFDASVPGPCVAWTPDDISVDVGGPDDG